MVARLWCYNSHYKCYLAIPYDLNYKSMKSFPIYREPNEGFFWSHSDLLILDSGYHLYLYDTLYVPSNFKNLISWGKLDRYGLYVNFISTSFNLYKDFVPYGSNFLVDDLYKIKLDNVFIEFSLVVNWLYWVKSYYSWWKIFFSYVAWTFGLYIKKRKKVGKFGKEWDFTKFIFCWSWNMFG